MPETPPVFKKSVPVAWLFKMAWRDSRKNRSRLFLFTSSIILGIAALVAVYSFRENLQRDIDEQAKTLTGSDLTIDSRKEVSKPMVAMLDSLGDQRAKQIDFASMVSFIKGDQSRLIQVRALEGNYPFYGSIETTPAKAAQELNTGRNALVDKTVMLQFNAKPGDSIKLGKLNFAIAGYLDQAAGQNGIGAAFSPVIYISMKYLPETDLVQFGSRLHYSWFYKFDQPKVVPKLVKELEPKLSKEGLEYETVVTKKRDTGRAFQDLSRFLALTGFIALLLGCIGVGSAIHVYVKEKLAMISTLRCLGVKAWEAFFIYLIQITFIGFAGAIVGALLGTGLQFLLPLVLKDLLPVDFTMRVSWIAIFQGVITGVVIAILFALPSLLAVRRISPLNAIRASFEESSARAEPLKWIVYLLIFLFVFGFTWLQMDSLLQTVVFTGSILLAIVVFYGLSTLLLWLIRKILPPGLSYVWRQGFSNLYRPNNQTMMLIVSIGLSTAFIATLYFVQEILISRVTVSASANQTNMILFDIQSNQKAGIEKLAKQFKLPVKGEVPMITMRLEEINGQNAAQLAKADSLANQGKPAAKDGERRESSSRAFKSEIRASYRSKLLSSEQLISGHWTSKLKSPSDTVFISLDDRYAERIGVKLGDQMLFNVQGMMLPTVVGSLRKINWAQMNTNFRVIFPEGILEDAPQSHILMTKVPDAKVSAAFQSAIVSGFSNVSVIDLKLVLQVLDELLGKISFIIRFMASFSIITGWIVLISAVRSSKNQRLREIVLLRTLGAKGTQILSITAIEYLFLGMLAAGAGLLMATAAGWALAEFSFDAVFVPPLWPVLILFGAITGIVVITGMLSSRSILNHPPLEVLRKDS